MLEPIRKVLTRTSAEPSEVLPTSRRAIERGIVVYLVLVNRIFRTVGYTKWDTIG